ncbi:hypothetical protein BOX15_Mlig008005g2 [Macrostomum lignano]|uniref:Uncharacterized protein n=1 Tax=Macrostomum lignano TaxID=282301 RepID=A0A267EXB1_9PLAT|nr:hypothetical protein BOX15_Mlig008005g2 [Macrostomum lignano]
MPWRPPQQQKLVYTALHQAVLDCRPDQVRLLVERCDASVDSQEVFGRTPLMLCCLLDCQPVAMAIARALLKAGPDLELKDNLGRTALGYACIYGREALVLHMARTQVLDPTEPDNDGCTPLHHAAVQGNPRITCVLVDLALENRSTVDCRNRLGLTPLMLACQSGNCRAGLYLLLNGCASAYLRDNSCFLSALDWLERSGSGSRTAARKAEEVRRIYTAGAVRPRISSQQRQHEHWHRHQQPEFTYRQLHSARSSTTSVSSRRRRHDDQRVSTTGPAAATNADDSLPRLAVPTPPTTPASTITVGAPLDTGRRPSIDDPLRSERTRLRPRPATVSAFRVQFLVDDDQLENGAKPVADAANVGYGGNDGKIVSVDVDALTEQAARRLLARRLRAQAAQYSYLGGGEGGANGGANSRLSSAASIASFATVNRQRRPVTSSAAYGGSASSARGGCSSSEVANACRLLQMLHDARTAPPPATQLSQSAAAAAAAAVAAAVAAGSSRSSGGSASASRTASVAGSRRQSQTVAPLSAEAAAMAACAAASKLSLAAAAVPRDNAASPKERRSVTFKEPQAK